MESTASFRVTGRQPQLWDPVTGQRRPLLDYEQRGHTLIPMRLEPRQSFFVVFPKAKEGRQPAKRRPNFPEAQRVAEIEGPWQVAFDPRWGGPEQVEFSVLEDWSKRAEPGIRYYSGTATYRKTFDLPSSFIPLSSSVYLDLGKVRNLARVRLNGKDLGIVWCAPWRVDAGNALKPKDNRLEIEVVNTWVNRIIGDQQEPPDTEMVKVNKEKGGYQAGVEGMALKDLPDWLLSGKPRPSRRYTFINWQFYPKDAPLPESGLIGPVRITAQRRRRVPGRTGLRQAKGNAGNLDLGSCAHVTDADLFYARNFTRGSRLRK